MYKIILKKDNIIEYEELIEDNMSDSLNYKIYIDLKNGLSLIRESNEFIYKLIYLNNILSSNVTLKELNIKYDLNYEFISYDVKNNIHLLKYINHDLNSVYELQIRNIIKN